MHAVNQNKDETNEQPEEQKSEETAATESKSEESTAASVSIESEGQVQATIPVESGVEAEIAAQLEHPAKTTESESQEAAETPSQTETEQPASESNEGQSTEESNEEVKTEDKPQEEPSAPSQSQGDSVTRNIEDDDTVISEATTEISAKETKKNSSDSNKHDLIDYLTKFIDTDEEINDVLAGYFARLCNLLIQKRGEEMALYFYSNKQKLLRFADHSYSKSISEIAVKILDINIDKLDFDKAVITQTRVEFLERLLTKLKEGRPEVLTEYSLNIFQIFNDLTYKKAMYDGTNIIKYYDMLIEQNILNTLGEILLISSPETSSIAAIRIINVLISHLRDHLTSTSKAKQIASDNLSDDESVLVKETPEETEAAQDTNKTIATHPLVEFIKTQVIDHLIEQLEVPPSNGVIDFQYAKQQYTLGKKRLSIINLMESLVDLEDAGVRQKILESSFYTKLFDLFLEFPFNSFLHLHLENIFNAIIKDSSTEVSVKMLFLDKLKIFKKLPSFWVENQVFTHSSSREFRHSYLAFTTKFANTLTELAKTVPELAERLQEEQWQEFQIKDVDMINEKNAIVLAKGRDKKEESDDRFKELDERDDLEDDEDEEYSASRKPLRDAIKDIGDLGKDDDDDDENLFEGLGTRDDAEGDKDDDEHHEDEKQQESTGENVHVDKHEQFEVHTASQDTHAETQDQDVDDKQEEKDDVTENSGYYDNNYWGISQYNIEDLLRS